MFRVQIACHRLEGRDLAPLQPAEEGHAVEEQSLEVVLGHNLRVAIADELEEVHGVETDVVVVIGLVTAVDDEQWVGQCAPDAATFEGGAHPAEGAQLPALVYAAYGLAVLVVALEQLWCAVRQVEFQRGIACARADPVELAADEFLAIGEAGVHRDLRRVDTADAFQIELFIEPQVLQFTLRQKRAVTEHHLVAETAEPFALQTATPFLNVGELGIGPSPERAAQDVVAAERVDALAELFQIVLIRRTVHGARALGDETTHGQPELEALVGGSVGGIALEFDLLAEGIARATTDPESRAFHRIETVRGEVWTQFDLAPHVVAGHDHGNDVHISAEPRDRLHGIHHVVDHRFLLIELLVAVRVPIIAAEA